MSTAATKEYAKSSPIAAEDRIRQADAAKILGCSRQRVLERVKNGSLKHCVVTDALDNEERYVSHKQVLALKKTLGKQTKAKKSA